MTIFQVSIIEMFLFAAAAQLHRESDDVSWLALPLRVRRACLRVESIGIRRANPIDLAPLLAALRVKPSNEGSSER